MGIPDKLATQASKNLGETVLAAAMVVPPGATLYKAYSPSSRSLVAGGPIAAAILSKKQGAANGDAGRFPTQQGVLAVTAERVIFFKKKRLGVGVGGQLTEWPRTNITFDFEDNGKWSYPGLLIGFPDESSCVVFGEKRWGLDGIATII